MSIRVKLFLIVGLLLLVVSLLTYFLPDYLVKNDLEKASRYASERINKQEMQVMQIIEYSIERYFNQAERSLNSVKEILIQSNAVTDALKEEDRTKLGSIADKVFLLDPDIVLIKFINKENGFSTIFPKNQNVPLIEESLNDNTNSLMINSDSGEILISQAADIGNQYSIVLGTSLSKILREIADTYNRNIVIHSKDIVMGYSNHGVYEKSFKNFPINQLKAKQGDFQWNNTDYVYQKISLLKDEVELFFFIPESESLSVAPFLVKVRDEIIKKISFDLSSVVLICLILALFFLEWLSKKITQPIVKLANATIQVSKGHYETVHLPHIASSRHDEIATLYHSFNQMVMHLKDREQIRGVLNKVVSKEIAEEILKKHIKLEGEERFISVFFSDIRGFTKFSEKTSADQLFKDTNTYLNLMCPIIDEEKGVVDKFVGDEIMALYGTPIEHPEHAYHAVMTAIRMMRALEAWNKERVANHFDPIEIGIGIHTGPVFAGNVGAQDRLNYTVLGAGVNLASRLCSVANPMQIIVSQGTIEHISKAKFSFKQLPSFQLKGIDGEVVGYEIDWKSNNNKSS